MTERTMTKADLITSAVLIVLSVAVTVNSLGMPTMAGRGESPYSGPGVVPAFLGVMTFLLSLAMLMRSLKRGALKFIGEDSKKKGEIDRDQWRRIAITVGLSVLYAFLLGKVWFPLVTFLFVFVFVMLFEYDFKASFSGQWKKALFAGILALLTAASVFLVFQYLFLVNLP